jgi:DNA-binding MarR family transcriptional regulator
MTLSESQYNVLATIAKYRSVGISQADLAKVCDYDSRSVFHYIKCLGQMNFM